jgi:hypothetical protein
MLHPKIRGVACSRQRPALATVVGYLYVSMDVYNVAIQLEVGSFTAFPAFPTNENDERRCDSILGVVWRAGCGIQPIRPTVSHAKGPNDNNSADCHHESGDW